MRRTGGDPHPRPAHRRHHNARRAPSGDGPVGRALGQDRVVPIRLTSRRPRRAGPAPFSAEWLNAPPTPPERRVPALPPWFPSERLLSAGLVLLLVAVAALAAAGDERPNRVAAPTDASIATDAADGGAVAMAAATTVPPDAAAATAVPPATAVPTVAAPSLPPQPTPTYVPAPNLAAAVPTVGAGGPTGDALLPRYRLLTFYGHPHDPNMGILGEYDKEELLAKLREQAAAYEAADPARPVMIGFEVIATVAQREPGVDGTYLLPTDKATLEEYADFAAANNILLFVDVQIGRDTVANEIEKVRFLLERPHVHLALDPEFAIAEGQIPGIDFGGIDAWTITQAQETLAAISAQHGIPPKVLIVHQFVHEMIRYKDQLYPIPGVQLVINADGHGSPALKTELYHIMVRNELVQYGGVKLFYRSDMDFPLMEPADVVALDPPPDVVMYQ